MRYFQRFTYTPYFSNRSRASEFPNKSPAPEAYAWLSMMGWRDGRITANSNARLLLTSFSVSTAVTVRSVRRSLRRSIPKQLSLKAFLPAKLAMLVRVVMSYTWLSIVARHWAPVAPTSHFLESFSVSSLELQSVLSGVAALCDASKKRWPASELRQ